MTSDAGLEIDFTARLCASLDSMAAVLRAEQQRHQALASEVWHVHAPAIPFAALPAFGAAWGPNTGYAWAVQRLTVAGFGAATDAVTAYRGLSAADVAPQNALYTFTVPAAGDVSTWHPGRTGLILMPDEGLAFGGTFTGTLGVVSADVIQLTVRQLPGFLM